MYTPTMVNIFQMYIHLGQPYALQTPSLIQLTDPVYPLLTSHGLLATIMDTVGDNMVHEYSQNLAVEGHHIK